MTHLDSQRYIDLLFRKMLLYLCRGVAVLEVLLVVGRLAPFLKGPYPPALLLNPLVSLAVVLGAMALLVRVRPTRAFIDGVCVLIVALISLNIGLVSLWVKNPVRLFSFAPLLVVTGVFIRSWRAHLAATAACLGSLAFGWVHAPLPRESVGLAVAIFVMAVVLGGLLHVLVSAMVERMRRLLARLMTARARVATLESLIPICSHCKKVRNDEGFWEQVETYVSQRTQSTFSHGICPDCREVHWPQGQPPAGGHS